MKSPWPTKKLGEICEIIAGQAPPSQFYNEEGEGIPFLTVNSFGRLYPKITRWTTKPLRIATEKDVLFSVAGSLGLVNLGINACITRSIFALRPKENYITQKFLFYVLKKFGPIMALSGSGTAQKVITIEQIKNFQIPLPPLPIQQKIVSILDTIQSAIEVQEKIIEKTKELKKSMMNLLSRYGIKALKVKELLSSRVGELTSSEIEKLGIKLKKTEIGEIPEDWEVVRLGEVCEIYQPQTITFKEIKSKGPYKVYGANGVIGYYDKYNHENEEVLITCRGSTCGTVTLSEPKSWITGNAMVVSPKSVEEINKYFLFHLLSYSDLNATISGSGQPQITRGSLAPFEIVFPPLSEQREIAEILQTIDQKIEIEQKKKALYEELFKIMLNKIMNQEVDVEKVKI